MEQKYYIGLDNGYCGIVTARNEYEARIRAKHSIKGRFGGPAKDYDPDIVSVSLASEVDLFWVKGMGGVT